MRGGIALLLLFLARATAATIVVQGTVYDAQLQPLAAVIFVNTTPEQVMVASNGSYRVQVLPGTYALRAVSAENMTLEQVIDASHDGVYTVDFVLTQANQQNSSASPLPVIDPRKDPMVSLYGIIGIIALALAAAAGYAWWKKHHEEHKPPTSDEHTSGPGETHFDSASGLSPNLPEEEEILRELTRAGGILTQKELRHRLSSWSEARVSMLLTSLENQGKVQKIKKGRGNIVRLKQ